MKQGYFLITFGKEYIDEAVYFVKTLRKVGDNLPVSILCSENDVKYVESHNIFDKVIIFDFNNKFSLKDKTSFEKYGGTPKILMMEYIPYDETIYLDSDMLVQYDTTNVWNYMKQMQQAYTVTGIKPEINDTLILELSKKIDIPADKINFIHSGIVYMNKNHKDYMTFYNNLKFFWENYYQFGLGNRLFRGGKADEHAIIAAYNKMNYKIINPFEVPIITHNYHHDIELPSNIVTGGGMYNIAAKLNSPPPFIHMFKDCRDNHYNILINRLLNL